MSIIKKMRKQKAVWWKRSGVDQYGRSTFEGPVEIDCRWEDRQEEFRTLAGEVRTSTSVVYVDREMSVGDMLQKVEMDSDTPLDPRDIEEAREIQSFELLPNLRNTENLLTARL